MKSSIKYYKGADLIAVDVNGSFDLKRSKQLIQKIVKNPEYDKHYELVLDLQDISCDLSVAEVYKIASYMAYPNPEYPSHRKIAVVVADSKAFDHALFFETCALNRGLQVKSFRNVKDAENWLQTDLSLTEESG